MFLHRVCCIWQNVCDGSHFVKMFEIFLVYIVETYEYALAENRYETGDFGIFILHLFN